MKKAFSLVELIFVIVIIGIISGVGFFSYKPNYHLKDAEFIILKLKTARYKAIADDSTKFTTNDKRCVELTKESLNESIKKATLDVKEKDIYQMKSDIIALNNAPIQICFDYIGRAHDGRSGGHFNLSLNTLIKQKLEYEIKYASNSCKIALFEYSGYAIIECAK